MIADPPVYTAKCLTTWVTISDVFDAHEILDLREAAELRAQREANNR